jgi:hypothetical protein
MFIAPSDPPITIGPEAGFQQCKAKLHQLDQKSGNQHPGNN